MEKLLWVDLEMTGLDLDREVILEVAAVATDWKLNTLATYHSVVRQPSSYLENMDDWNKKHHGQSGLLEEISSGKEPHLVEKDLIDFVKKNFKSSHKITLAGNSVYHDKKFIEKYFKNFSTYLHYRLLDISSLKILLKNLFNVRYDKKGTHRAKDDIFESIEELKTYLKFLNSLRNQNP